MLIFNWTICGFFLFNQYRFLHSIDTSPLRLSNDWWEMTGNDIAAYEMLCLTESNTSFLWSETFGRDS